jgi:hypothetical protein
MSGLLNALIRRKNGQGLRRVVRDDGLDGLQIANPNEGTATMRPLSLEEFQSDWEVVRTGDQQSTEDISRTIFGSAKPPVREVRMNTQEFTNQFTSEVNPMAEEPRLTTAFESRSEDTDREAMKREILGMPAIDAQSDGQPVAANEDPISTMEEDRMDDESGQTGDPEAQAEAEALTPAEDTNAEGDEPIAANEDPTESADAPKRRGRKPKAG